jgi:hypothetical protein
MSYLDVTTYQNREKQWREFAAKLSAGPERDACIALAEGYANLIAILLRLGAPDGTANVGVTAPEV